MWCWTTHTSSTVEVRCHLHDCLAFERLTVLPQFGTQMPECGSRAAPEVYSVMPLLTADATVSLAARVRKGLSWFAVLRHAMRSSILCTFKSALNARRAFCVQDAHTC